MPSAPATAPKKNAIVRPSGATQAHAATWRRRRAMPAVTPRSVNRPVTCVVRRITPAKVADHHVPVVTFFMVSILYVIVTLERINLCVQLGMEVCR